VYPAKPTVGVRADRPNGAWHVDCTILKLLDGSKAYVHAVIDNFSRRILAWTVEAKLSPSSTCRVLGAAARSMDGGARTADVFMDGGSENVNGAVDRVFDVTPLRRVLAQIDVSYSNSPMRSRSSESSATQLRRVVREAGEAIRIVANNSEPG
jgi:hypothetical protein